MPAVASDADGDFAIAWASLGQDGNGYGVYAQRYLANGAVVGGELRVNTYTTDMQYAPAIAMDAAGDAVVVWESINQNGHLDGVYAQRYDTSGAPAGGEFNLASYSTGGHAMPAVAMDAAGSFVADWEIYDTSGSGWDIYARQYNLAAVRIAAPVGGAHVVEGGATASYNLSLSTIPTVPVSVTLTPANAQLNLGNGVGNPRVLIFATDSTALISQTVVVAAVDDSIAQGDRTTTIGLTIVSGDAGYSGASVPVIVNGQLTVGALPVAIADNDAISYKLFVPLAQR